jgi:putative two-component system response regulator
MPHRMSEHARILIVDDEPTNVQVLRRLLRADFSRIESTTDPRKAAELYVEHRPELILLDLHLPAMSGLEVIDQLNAIAGATYLPILMMTGDLRPGARQEVQSHNMRREAKVRSRTGALEAAQRRRPDRGW